MKRIDQHINGVKRYLKARFIGLPKQGEKVSLTINKVIKEPKKNFSLRALISGEVVRGEKIAEPRGVQEREFNSVDYILWCNHCKVSSLYNKTVR